MQQASCLEGGPLLWIWPLYLHVDKKSDDDDDDDEWPKLYGVLAVLSAIGLKKRILLCWEQFFPPGVDLMSKSYII